MLQLPKPIEAIHLFKLNGRNFVIDINSAFSFEIDNLCWDVLQGCETDSNALLLEKLSAKYEPSQIENAIVELGELEARGFLFAPDPYDEEDYIPRLKPLKAVFLHVSHMCNLACAYCFADGGHYKAKRMLMSPETGENAVDFLFEQSGAEEELKISFFGGEPLMNFDVIKHTMEYAEKQQQTYRKRVLFDLSTNVTLFSQKIEDYFISKKDNIGTIVLSFDALPEYQNQMRPFIGHHNSYEVCLRNIKRILKSPLAPHCVGRATYTALNPNFSKQAIALTELGFSTFSVDYCWAPQGSVYRFTEKYIATIREEFLKWLDYYFTQLQQGKPPTFYILMKSLRQIFLGAKTAGVCGAGYEYLAIHPNGDIYPCYRLMAFGKDFYMGNVNEGTCYPHWGNRLNQIWVKKRQPCRSCWARYMCGASGGCYAVAYSRHGNLYQPDEIYCELTKVRIEVGVLLYARLLDEFPSLLPDLIMPPTEFKTYQSEGVLE